MAEDNEKYATKALPEHCDANEGESLVMEQDIMPQNNLNKVSLQLLDSSENLIIPKDKNAAHDQPA